MRVNVYGEELTQKVELVKKTVNQELFCGIRFYLKSHPDLHHSEGDNDESAITIWMPWTKKNGNDFQFVYNILYSMITEVVNAKAKQEQNRIKA
jgi:hypothetical protein